MEVVLARLLLPDSQEIPAATADIKAAFKQVGIPATIHTLAHHSHSSTQALPWPGWHFGL